MFKYRITDLSVFDSGKANPSKEDMAEVTREEHREQFDRDEQTAACRIACGVYLLGTGIEGLTERLKRLGHYRDARIGNAFMDKAWGALMQNMDTEQLMGIRRNVYGADVIISAPKESSLSTAYVAVEARGMEEIVNQCLRQCSYCDKSRSDSKYCTIKRALDNIPTLRGRITHYAHEDVTKCKYQFVEIDE